MERIKQALERARQERESAPARVVTQAEGHQAPPPETEITYTQTRTVNISHDAALKNRLLSRVGTDAVLGAYKMLRTQVLQRLGEHDWNTLAITGPAPDEGKTLTSVNLALSLARKVTHTVLLVDLDLRRPSVHRYLGCNASPGLSDYLTQDIPLKDILIHPGVDRLVVLPGGGQMDNSSEILSSPKMVRLVEELKTRYPSRLVLFDLPPLLSTDDALVFSPYVDAVLLVIEEGKTKQEDLKRAMALLEATPVIGTVLNKSEERMASHY